ncbi:hypothetical protein N7456_011937 [Penicillium angulare]|uniref:Glucose-methanol-choline oxidoreductase C-terminal domain-containing protein n=1 Tax=Penicillium angulare TaxID=116970 RepID=A0A9W9K0M6_9EURO|nr:hypothetical protein N7456_011937 [Penicillium angulare]
MEDHLLRKGPKHSATIAAYQEGHQGPMSCGLLEMVGFPRIEDYLEKDPQYVKTKAANGGKDPFVPLGQPHFELDFVCMFETAFQWHLSVSKKGQHTCVVVDLVRPVSDLGEVTLNSADPLVQPNINLNFFSDDLDIIAMREGIRFSYDVLKRDEEMKRAVLDRCQTAFYPCGTARLSRNIEQGVVDPKLRVHGIKNLRLIGASVIPVIPDCRIQNSVYMIGEKGADAI